MGVRPCVAAPDGIDRCDLPSDERCRLSTLAPEILTHVDVSLFASRARCACPVRTTVRTRVITLSDRPPAGHPTPRSICSSFLFFFHPYLYSHLGFLLLTICNSFGPLLLPTGILHRLCDGCPFCQLIFLTLGLFVLLLSFLCRFGRWRSKSTLRLGTLPVHFLFIHDAEICISTRSACSAAHCQDQRCLTPGRAWRNMQRQRSCSLVEDPNCVIVAA
jgi:hypothetical protein